MASGLDINGCVLSYFEGTANLHCYTSCTLTTLHCSKVSFLQCCHMKRYNKIFTKMWGVYSLLWDTVSKCTKKEWECLSLLSLLTLLTTLTKILWWYHGTMIVSDSNAIVLWHTSWYLVIIILSYFVFYIHPPALNASFFLLKHQWAFEPSVIAAWVPQLSSVWNDGSQNHTVIVGKGLNTQKC